MLLDFSLSLFLKFLVILGTFRFVHLLLKFFLSFFEKIFCHGVKFTLKSVLRVRHFRLWHLEFRFLNLFWGSISRFVPLSQGTLTGFFLYLILKLNLLCVLFFCLQSLLSLFLRSTLDSFFVLFKDAGNFSERNLQVRLIYWLLWLRNTCSCHWLRSFASFSFDYARLNIQNLDWKVLLLCRRFLDIGAILNLFSNNKAVGLHSSL